MRYFCVDIDATKTAELLGFNRKTVNRYYKIFREAVARYQGLEKDKIIGVVEIDESYFGRTRIKGTPGIKLRGRSTHKQPVFGIFERNGRVYTEIVPDVSKSTLVNIIRGKINPESVVNSDGWRAYDGLVDYGFEKHFRVNHGKEFTHKGCHINGIEAFWSFTKRRLSKFNGVKKNFELHLKECEWRHGKSTDLLLTELKKLVKINKR